MITSRPRASVRMVKVCIRTGRSRVTASISRTQAGAVSDQAARHKASTSWLKTWASRSRLVFERGIVQPSMRGPGPVLPKLPRSDK
ncbi:hypothetical protein PUR25_02775 [Streptomyces sp. JV181]|uniref:hypothetical protein n=1 Tax=Streptomyces sp. JV181 TaxID=858635 RepID=UPI002E77D644|nr:hypothetical protein [Streptomyces sp. JV181]MEE1774996.1 hypothetical protein [Streptomyces sp. JV181]